MPALHLWKYMGLKQWHWAPTSVWIGIVVVMSIVILVGISDIVLLSMSKCSFHLEVIPIFLMLFFVISTVETVLIYRTKNRNALVFTSEQDDSLLPEEEEREVPLMEGMQDTTSRVQRKCRLSGAVAFTFGLLDCIPMVLCLVWIYILIAHSVVDEENICKIRFWYSVAQATFFSALSFVGVIVALGTVLCYLCRSHGQVRLRDI